MMALRRTMIGQKKLPSWALLLNMLMQSWGSALGASTGLCLGSFPWGPNNQERFPEQLERSWTPPPPPSARFKNCREGDNRNKLKGWDWWPLMGLRIKQHSNSTKGPLIHPPFSFRCSSAPGLAPDRKQNTHLPGRVFA